MFEKLLGTLRPELSGARAFHHVERVSNYHRIQASPGYRDAAHYCAAALDESGLPGRVISYPANSQTQFWSQKLWQEWVCHKATLKIAGDEQSLMLADFADCPISLIQRSYPTPLGGLTLQVVVLDRGDDEEHYPDVDLAGKMVLTDGDINKVRKWAVGKRGAVGIISDRLAEVHPIRHRFDLPDARQYTSFWWTGQEQGCFGFVLSPKLGDGLRKRAAKGVVSVHAEVISEFYDGAFENVETLIAGESEEEILIVAHLCHPRPSANDNASGVGVALETARALQSLISSGRLPRPKRSIRILLVPEMTGTYAYLATNPKRAGKTLAAINLDMVGEKQELCQGPLVAEYPPNACDSFVGDLLATILGEVAQEVKNMGGTGSYALFKHTTAPFSGGSDHYILSDPSVNIPCPMLIQWPDKYYHTSEDTIDKVDPEMLYRVALITATYAYYLANLNAKEAMLILNTCAKSYLERLQALLNGSLAAISQEIAPKSSEETRSAVNFLLERQCNQLLSLRRFVNEETFESELTATLQHIHSSTEREWARFESLTKHMGTRPQQQDAGPNVPGAELIPRRVFPGPLSMRGHVEKLAPVDQAQYESLAYRHGAPAMRTCTDALYWVDGHRTIGEISRLVQHSVGFSNTAFLVEYLQLLAKMELVVFA